MGCWLVYMYVIAFLSYRFLVTTKTENWYCGKIYTDGVCVCVRGGAVKKKGDDQTKKITWKEADKEFSQNIFRIMSVHIKLIYSLYTHLILKPPATIV